MSLLFDFDKNNKSAKYLIGTDEAGRGPLAGPVVAAAVCFKNITPSLIEALDSLNDSKKLTHLQREKLFDVIKNNTIHSIVSIDVEEIESINILQASLKAMRVACSEVVSQIGDDVEVFVDGNKKIPSFMYKQKYIVKGDSKSASVAAASILAKVYRDSLMGDLAKEFPQYFWEDNKGYGTKKHVEAIKKYGVTKYHRQSFLTKILQGNQLEIIQLKMDF